MSINKDSDQKNAVCDVCFHHCRLEDGQTGFCRARVNRNGVIVPENAGRAVSLALDPIEKKPLNRFYPGRYILSYGSYGCNLRCPFCQNYEISQAGEEEVPCREFTPEELVRTAVSLRRRPQGNLGIAFTYNEPMIAWEYIRDVGKVIAAADEDLKIVLVTNGTAEVTVLEKVLPYVDAMNIDLKGFRESFYRDYLQGDLEEVKAFIARAVQDVHVELTTLIIPGRNDSEEEMKELSAWVASLPAVNPEQRSSDPDHPGRNIPLHISRYFPRWQETEHPTDVGLIYHLRDVAAENLQYVYTGNC